MRVQFLYPEDPPEEGMATHSCILFWRIQWTEEPGGLAQQGRTESDTAETTQHQQKHQRLIVPYSSCCCSHSTSENALGNMPSEHFTCEKAFYLSLDLKGEQSEKCVLHGCLAQWFGKSRIEGVSADKNIRGKRRNLWRWAETVKIFVFVLVFYDYVTKC